MIVPRDWVKTGVSSQDELFINDKSLIRVDRSSIFRFEPGVHRFELKNHIAINEVIFKLENGMALILSPPGSVVTKVETPQSKISIFAAYPLSCPIDHIVQNSAASESSDHLTSVSQLSDVQPSDWAFTAFQSLVER